jgi:hypothetical protein
MKNNIIKGAFLLVMLSNITGCASYYSHYGSFSAQNSQGEERLFVVSWKTAEYPSWAIQDNKSTEILLESQCSERTWQLNDSVSEKNQCTESHKGIVACGDPALDLILSGKKLPDNNQVCISVSDSNSANKITDLGDSMLIKVSCLPDVISRKEGDETKNIDYLKASVVPYSVFTRKVDRYSFNDKAPFMSDKICESE